MRRWFADGPVATRKTADVILCKFYMCAVRLLSTLLGVLLMYKICAVPCTRSTKTDQSRFFFNHYRVSHTCGDPRCIMLSRFSAKQSHTTFLSFPGITVVKCSNAPISRKFRSAPGAKLRDRLSPLKPKI